MTVLSHSRRQYTTDCTCVECVFFLFKRFLFVLFCFVGYSFPVKIVFIEVEILF